MVVLTHKRQYNTVLLCIVSRYNDITIIKTVEPGSHKLTQLTLLTQFTQLTQLTQLTQFATLTQTRLLRSLCSSLCDAGTSTSVSIIPVSPPCTARWRRSIFANMVESRAAEIRARHDTPMLPRRSSLWLSTAQFSQRPLPRSREHS